MHVYLEKMSIAILFIRLIPMTLCHDICCLFTKIFSFKKNRFMYSSTTCCAIADITQIHEIVTYFHLLLQKDESLLLSKQKLIESPVKAPFLTTTMEQHRQMAQEMIGVPRTHLIQT